MQAEVDQLSSVQVGDFIDTISKLVAAVLYVDDGLGVGNIAPVYVGDSAHGGSKAFFLEKRKQRTLIPATLRSLGVSATTGWFRCKEAKGF